MTSNLASENIANHALQLRQYAEKTTQDKLNNQIQGWFWLVLVTLMIISLFKTAIIKACFPLVKTLPHNVTLFTLI